MPVSNLSIRLLLALSARGSNKWAQAGWGSVGLGPQLLGVAQPASCTDGAHHHLHNQLPGVVGQLQLQARGFMTPAHLAFKTKPSTRLGGRSRYQLDEVKAGGSSVEAEFYLNLNSDPEQDPNAVAKQKGAIQGFVAGIKELLAQSAAKFGAQTPDVARSEPAFVLELPQSFPQDPSKMFQDTLRAMVRLSGLPVEPWYSNEDGRDSRLQRQWIASDVAKQLAADLNVLLAAMEALPRFKRRTSYYNVLLAALAQAGDAAAADALYTRMAAQHKGPSCQPDLETASQLFSAYVKHQDLQGMLRTLQTVSSSSRLGDTFKWQLPALLSRLASACAKQAARRGETEVVQQVVALVEQLSDNKTVERPITLSHSLLVNLMTEAAKADNLELAMKFWDKLQLQVPTPGYLTLDMHAYDALLQAAARSEDTPSALDCAHKVFSALKSSLAARAPPAGQPGTPTPPTPPTPPPPIDAAATPEAVPTTPSISAYVSYIHVLGKAQQWSAAFDVVHQLITDHAAAKPKSVSAMHGLAPLAEAVFKAPGGAAAAYEALVSRQLKGEPVSNAMMNVVLRGMALTGGIDLVSKLFEEYDVAGLTQDVGAYNAVLEACTVAAQPLKAASVLEYMKLKSVQPTAETMDLLLRSYLAAGDVAGGVAALLDTRKLGLTCKISTLEQAVELAKQGSHAAAELEFTTELDFQREQEQKKQEQRRQREERERQRRWVRQPEPDAPATAATASPKAAA